ncbi:spore coat protein CotF [Staphylococcus caledonicus]
MKLIRSQSIFYYYGTKLTEYELLTQYNPMFINSKIRAIQEQINAMYHLNTSHTVCDEVAGVITVSYPVEKLVIWITDQKDELNRFKINSTKKLNLLKKIIGNYKPKEQKEVMDYMRSHGRIRTYETIDKLQRDLYKIKNYNHINSARKDDRATAV